MTAEFAKMDAFSAKTVTSFLVTGPSQAVDNGFRVSQGPQQVVQAKVINNLDIDLGIVARKLLHGVHFDGKSVNFSGIDGTI